MYGIVKGSINALNIDESLGEYIYTQTVMHPNLDRAKEKATIIAQIFDL